MYPKLITRASTPAHVELLRAEPNEYNERETVLSADLLCNFQAGGQIIFGEQKQQIQLSGTALFDGDICPGYDEPAAGSLRVFGTEYRIVRAQKWRNPDGSVNYTRLDVI